jgi:hypothetical protein
MITSFILLGYVSLQRYIDQINLIDYPSCTVPVTFADKQIDKKDTTYKPISDSDKLVWDKCNILR